MRSAQRGLRTLLRMSASPKAALQPIAEDYVDRWMDAVERGDYPPDPTDLFTAAAAERVPVLSPIPIDAYLRQCFKTGRIPDEARIVQAIAHAYAEVDLMDMNKTCRCPARRPVFQRPGAAASRETE